MWSNVLYFIVWHIFSPLLLRLLLPLLLPVLLPVLLPLLLPVALKCSRGPLLSQQPSGSCSSSVPVLSFLLLCQETQDPDRNSINGSAAQTRSLRKQREYQGGKNPQCVSVKKESIWKGSSKRSSSLRTKTEPQTYSAEERHQCRAVASEVSGVFSAFL